MHLPTPATLGANLVAINSVAAINEAASNVPSTESVPQRSTTDADSIVKNGKIAIQNFLLKKKRPPVVVVDDFQEEKPATFNPLFPMGSPPGGNSSPENLPPSKIAEVITQSSSLNPQVPETTQEKVSKVENVESTTSTVFANAEETVDTAIENHKLLTNSKGRGQALRDYLKKVNEQKKKKVAESQHTIPDITVEPSTPPFTMREDPTIEEDQTVDNSKSSSPEQGNANLNIDIDAALSKVNEVVSEKVDIGTTDTSQKPLDENTQASSDIKNLVRIMEEASKPITEKKEVISDVGKVGITESEDGKIEEPKQEVLSNGNTIEKALYEMTTDLINALDTTKQNDIESIVELTFSTKNKPSRESIKEIKQYRVQLAKERDDLKAQRNNLKKEINDLKGQSPPTVKQEKLTRKSKKNQLEQQLFDVDLQLVEKKIKILNADYSTKPGIPFSEHFQEQANKLIKKLTSLQEKIDEKKFSHPEEKASLATIEKLMQGLLSKKDMVKKF